MFIRPELHPELPFFARVTRLAPRREGGGRWPSRSVGRGGRIPDRDIVVVGRTASGARLDRSGRKRLVAVVIGALVGAALHYGAYAAREWAVITVPSPETRGTMIT